MDSETRGRGNQRNGIADLAFLRQAPFSEVENRFLDLLSSDMEEAGHWFRILRKSPWDLSALEKARLDRLIGRYYEVSSNHRKAVEWTGKARTAFEALGFKEGVYQCLLTLFAAYLNSGRYEKARACAYEALTDTARSDSEKLKVLINLGSLEHRLHRYLPALRHFKDGLELLHDNPKIEAIALYNMANVLVCINKFSEAEDNYKQALILFKSQQAIIYQAHVLQAMGHLNSILGQYFHAETQLLDARDLYQRRGDKVGAALCEFDLFQLKIRLNKNEAALSEADLLIDKFRELDLPYETGLVYFHAAKAAIAMEDHALAEGFLDEAVSFFTGAGNRHYLALCSMLQGILFWKSGELDQARDHINIAHRIFVDKNIKELELESLIYLYRIDGRLLQERDYRRVRLLLSAPIGYKVRTQALLLVSEYRYARGQIKKAIESRFEAVMTIEESRASIISEDLRESFFGDKTEAYESLVEWLFQWKNPRASQLIFKVLGLSRNRQFTERLSQLERLPPVLNQREPTLLAMSKLKIRLEQLGRKLHDFSNDLHLSETEKETLLHSFKETSQKLRQFKTRMRDEERLGIFFPFDITPEEIQKHLPDATLVVSYFLGRSRLYRVELDRGGLHTFSLPLPADFRKNLNLLANILANRLFGKEDSITELLEKLSGLILPQKRKGNRHLVFIPHKYLQSFPFPLLSFKGRFLLEKHTLSLCPNLSALYFNLKKERPRLEKPLFFFSNHPDDPKAPERAFLCSQFPQAPVFDELHSDLLPPRTFDSDFIHFAGHCYFDRKEPNQSHLLLSGKKVYLSQLKNQHLNGPFINLASCQSGSMALMAGNELYGFVASFFAMGATNILAGMWDIDDCATGEWMTLFYRNIEMGLAEAHRMACLSLMEIHPEPYYWAGFCLFGKP